MAAAHVTLSHPDKALLPGRFTLRTMPERLRDADPWHDLPAPVSLGKARQRVGDLAA